ncbi:MAG TPA: hypothetical protein PLE22_00285 [Acidovorax sp.]|nr:hypothetical protein [Acidovorax sp.]
MTAPCKVGPRHKWAWLKNVTNAQIGGRSARFTLRGLYRCECGARKVGAPNHNDVDLRDLFQPSQQPRP